MAEDRQVIEQAIKVMVDKGGKYLSFSLAEEEYGIGILKIKEIIGMMNITVIPKTPKYVKGVINLRGKVIPVIDLRAKFGMGSVEYTDRTCIIVVEIDGQTGTMLMGIVVDSVSEVLNVGADNIEPPPAFGASVDTGYILGMAKMDSGVKNLLDINKVLNANEIEGLEKVS